MGGTRPRDGDIPKLRSSIREPLRPERRSRTRTLEQPTTGSKARSRQQWPSQRASQFELLAGELAVRLNVFLARLLNDMVRQRGSRWVLVPPNRFKVVAHKLLIVGELRSSRTVALGRPEARGVGSEYFVGQSDISIDEAEFKLCISNDDAAFFRVLYRERVNAKCKIAQLLCRGLSDHLHHLGEWDVDVVSAGRFRRWSEDRL